MSQSSHTNRLLRAMPASAFDALSPCIQRVDTCKLQIITEPNVDTDFAYFPAAGQASILAGGAEREAIEVAIVGCEGVVGLCLSPLTRQTPLTSMIQVPGFAWRVSSLDLMECSQNCPELGEYLGRFSHYLNSLTAYTALSHGSYSVSERLARWILMAHDRTEGDTLHFVHEFLALMLCVRRAGVTTALHVLEGEHAIEAKRGVIYVKDRGVLLAFANGSYGPPEREYERLFGTGFAKPC